MTKETLNIKVSGHLRLYNVDTGEVYYDDHNALTSNAPNIIRRALGASNNQLDQIKALKAAAVLSVQPVTSVVYASIDEVTLKAIFPPAAFDDTLDELQLGNTVNGLFSKVTGLSVYKDFNTQIGVDWKLKIVT